VTRERKPSQQTLQLLSALAAQPRQWTHGYDLSMATGLKSGTLYPILMRLSDREFLEQKWQDSPDPGRPPRHMYRLTATGLGFALLQSAGGESMDSAIASQRSPA
jgi:PadR family transcriptional regulator, regulatory protein PadR